MGKINGPKKNWDTYFHRIFIGCVIAGKNYFHFFRPIITKLCTQNIQCRFAYNTFSVFLFGLVCAVIYGNEIYAGKRAYICTFIPYHRWFSFDGSMSWIGNESIRFNYGCCLSFVWRLISFGHITIMERQWLLFILNPGPIVSQLCT